MSAGADPSLVTVLVAAADVDARRWLRESAGAYALEEVDGAAAALERLAAAPPRILVVGDRLADGTGAELLARAAEGGLLGGPEGPAVLALGSAGGAEPEPDESAVPIFYRLTPALDGARVRELLARAIAPAPAPRPPGLADALALRHVLEHAKRIGRQPDLPSAARTAAAAVLELAGAARARVLFYDDETGALWPEGEGEGHDAHASAGIAGFAVRTKTGAAVARAEADPLYRAAIDDPAGDGTERLAAQPVADRDGRVHGVMIAIRTADQAPFGEVELRKLEALADAWAPFIHQLALQQETEQILRGPERPGSDVFRQEAIEHFVRRGQRGDIIRVHPGWVHAAYWLVVVFVLGGAAFAAVARVHKWSEGPAVVRVTGRTDVTTYEGGTITALAVAPDQAVTAGQELARLHDSEQAAILRAQSTEFERKLVAYLQMPGDPTVKQALSALVSARESARARSEARVIRAPHDGVVKSLHVAPGQRVEPGKTILSLVEQGAQEGMSVYAFLPQSDTSQIAAGQRLRFTLPGYRGAYVELRVDAISDPMGVADARDRYLGDRFKDSVPIAGQVVVVQARLATPTFSSEGTTYQLHDGMLGVAEVQLESRSVFQTLVPGL
ncbi:MAG TPA: HlyD family efflux transporter periplasmic adaptor subunit [Kofleriaceae bacterium]|nr:HlyD family efflux transporter periplasmic adaptor subunit [Kofleriaceae bacterium]